jgi:protein-ribulosamine 3-kinase
MQAIPQEILADLANIFGVKVSEFHVSGGGCINHGGKVVTSKGNFFLKWNDLHRFPGMFKAEHSGLALLKKTGTIRIPQVLCDGTSGEFQYILLEYIETRNRHSQFWKIFGEQLASLHRSSEDHYGLHHDNYIGSLPQHNKPGASWIEFFISHRLAAQLELFWKGNPQQKSLRNAFEKLFQKLPSLLAEERPSLLHGDLWAGNLITDNMGKPCLIDPAVYYGNREVDIAMTDLFGGFDHRYIESYNSVFPLQRGLEERLDIYKLYPLLVHVNLFGESYLPQVVSILKRFV